MLWVTLQAWCLLALFDSTRMMGVRLIYAVLRGTPARVSKPIRCAPGEIVWAVDEACVWYFKRAPCLQRSAVATWLLRRYGIPASLVIGYRPMPFESHAWVEINGAIVNDRPQYQRFFTVLDRL
jgi:hypothetical protein